MTVQVHTCRCRQVSVPVRMTSAGTYFTSPVQMSSLPVGVSQNYCSALGLGSENQTNSPLGSGAISDRAFPRLIWVPVPFFPCLRKAAPRGPGDSGEAGAGSPTLSFESACPGHSLDLVKAGCAKGSTGTKQGHEPRECSSTVAQGQGRSKQEGTAKRSWRQGGAGEPLVRAATLARHTWEGQRGRTAQSPFDGFLRGLYNLPTLTMFPHVWPQSPALGIPGGSMLKLHIWYG